VREANIELDRRIIYHIGNPSVLSIVAFNDVASVGDPALAPGQHVLVVGHGR